MPHFKTFFVQRVVVNAFKIRCRGLLSCKDVARRQPASDLRAQWRGRGIEWQKAHLVQRRRTVGHHVETGEVGHGAPGVPGFAHGHILSLQRLLSFKSRGVLRGHIPQRGRIHKERQHVV